LYTGGTSFRRGAGTPWYDKVSFLCFSPRYLRRRDAPSVLVLNHTNFMDALYVQSRVLTTSVGKAAVANVSATGLRGRQ